MIISQWWNLMTNHIDEFNLDRNFIILLCVLNRCRILVYAGGLGMCILSFLVVVALVWSFDGQFEYKEPSQMPSWSSLAYCFAAIAFQVIHFCEFELHIILIYFSVWYSSYHFIHSKSYRKETRSYLGYNFCFFKYL